MLELRTNWTPKLSKQEATKSRNDSKCELYDLVQGLEDLLNIALSDAEAIASTYFGDAFDENSDTESEFQDSERLKEVYIIMKVGYIYSYLMKIQD